MDWALSNYLITNFGRAGINYVAPMTFLFLIVFWRLRNSRVLNGRLIYSVLFWFYCLYMVVYGWHLLMRFFMPGEWPSTYHYAAFFANGVFWLICLSLMLFGFLKGVDNRVDGGLAALLNRWMRNSRKLREKK